MLKIWIRYGVIHPEFLRRAHWFLAKRLLTRYHPSELWQSFLLNTVHSLKFIETQLYHFLLGKNVNLMCRKLSFNCMLFLFGLSKCQEAEWFRHYKLYCMKTYSVCNSWFYVKFCATKCITQFSVFQYPCVRVYSIYPASEIYSLPYVNRVNMNPSYATHHTSKFWNAVYIHSDNQLLVLLFYNWY